MITLNFDSINELEDFITLYVSRTKKMSIPKDILEEAEKENRRCQLWQNAYNNANREACKEAWGGWAFGPDGEMNKE